MTLGNALLGAPLLDEDPFPALPTAFAAQELPLPTQAAAGLQITIGIAAQELPVPTQMAAAGVTVTGMAEHELSLPSQRARGLGDAVFGSSIEAEGFKADIADGIDLVGEIVWLHRPGRASVRIKGRIIDAEGPVDLANGVMQQGRRIVFAARHLELAEWEGPPRERDTVITEASGERYTIDKVWPGRIGSVPARYDCAITGNI